MTGHRSCVEVFLRAASIRRCRAGAKYSPRGDVPHARRALRGSPGLRVRAALRRPGRAANALRRRGRGRSRAHAPRRARPGRSSIGSSSRRLPLSHARSRPTTSASVARTSRRGSRTTPTTSTTTSIERLADELDLRETTVVVQDWGGPIGLRLAVERPERVARLVILNTGIGAGRAPSEEWLRFREFVRRVGADLVPGQLIRISAVTELADEVVEAYNAPFPTPESKAGVLAFPELVPTEVDHPSAAKMLEVRAALERGSDRRSFSSRTPIRSSRSPQRSEWRHAFRAPGRPRSSPVPVTSCRRRRARRSPSGSFGSWLRRRGDLGSPGEASLAYGLRRPSRCRRNGAAPRGRPRPFAREPSRAVRP